MTFLVEQQYQTDLGAILVLKLHPIMPAIYNWEGKVVEIKEVDLARQEDNESQAAS